MSSCDRHRMARIFSDSILVLFGIFVLGFFLFPDAPTHYKYFYWLMVPAVFVIRPYIAEVISDRLVILTLLFAGYMALSGLWSEPFDGREYLVALRSVLAVLFFFFLLIGFANRYPVRFDVFLQLLCVVAAVTALVSLVVFYLDNPFPKARVHGIGRLTIINRGAGIYGVFAVLAAGYCFRVVAWKRYLFAVLAIVLFAFVVMSQTRSAIIAVLAGFLVLVVLEMRWKAMYAIAGLVLLTAVLKLAVPELWSSLGRSMPLRPAIWMVGIEQIKQAPLFGFGLLSDTMVPVLLDNASHPRFFRHLHNGYLATARDGGIVGLLLLLAIMASAYGGAIRVYRLSADARLIALMSYAALVVVPIQDRFFTKPREYWLYFWLPIALVVIYRKRSLRQYSASPGVAPDGRAADSG